MPVPTGPMALDHPGSIDAAVVGAKAASLARAARAGLPVLPGFVIPTPTCEAILGEWTDASAPPPLGAIETGLRRAWTELSRDGELPLVVRSSSSMEDGEVSSMAGMFASVLDVKGWDEFVAAVGKVLRSSRVLDLTATPQHISAPMAVLVQPQLESITGGILFGIDPITGDPDHLIVSAVHGGPDQLVSGEVDGERYVLTRKGRVVDTGGPARALLLDSRQRVALARLAAKAAREFHEPQDMEWGIGADGDLRLFQSRPVTSSATGAKATGPILGPGPVAETFPEALKPLEEELWVEPLRVAVAHALRITGAASRRRLAKSPVVATIGGRVAADLELFGVTSKRSFIAKLDPRPPFRRLKAAWRVGRLQAALPELAAAVIEEVDAQLGRVPALVDLTSEDLLTILARSKDALVSLYGHEILVGLLVPPDEAGVTAASVGLRALAGGRAEGFEEDELISVSPWVLALRPPAIGPQAPFPQTSSALPKASEDATGIASVREGLRMRARWVQELSSRTAWELATRLARVRLLPRAETVATLSMEELVELVERGVVPKDLEERSLAPTPPLPAAFRLSEDGRVIPEATPSEGAGVAAGGGRVLGTVVDAEQARSTSGVLVVRTLDPGLAPLLPRLTALVAETGSVLSHLAILAREYGVPTVVGVPGAMDRFPVGSSLIVDGSTGEVEIAEGGDA